MNPDPASVRATHPIPSATVGRRGPRGVQAQEVAQAADALLARGLKPTIERLRQELGGGSPNTISPLLDMWFTGLSARVAGIPIPAEDDLPTDLRIAWNHAKHEARTLATQALQGERVALEQGRAQLLADQAALTAREAQWTAAQVTVEQALAETRAALEALRAELTTSQNELAALRRSAAQELKTLREQVGNLRQANEALRGEHARALESREAGWRQERESGQAREAAHEKRFLAEVDRARQSVKTLETEMAKEKKRRAQLEDASGAERASLGAALQEARSMERGLRKELQEKEGELSRAQAQCQALEEKLGAAGQQLSEEKAEHRAARIALAQAIAAVGQKVAKRPSKRGSRAA